jgi:hypothetical protein
LKNCDCVALALSIELRAFRKIFPFFSSLQNTLWPTLSNSKSILPFRTLMLSQSTRPQLKSQPVCFRSLIENSLLQNTLPFSRVNRDLDLIIVVFCLLGVLNQVIPLCVAGAKVIDVCIEGDKLIREATKTVYNKGKTPKGKFIFS